MFVYTKVYACVSRIEHYKAEPCNEQVLGKKCLDAVRKAASVIGLVDSTKCFFMSIIFKSNNV